MRKSYRLVAGSIVLSCLLAGCDSGAGPGTATPQNPQAGLDAVKKLQQGAVPTAKGMKPAAEAGKTK